MRRLLLVLAILLAQVIRPAAPAGADIEIVESVPAETSLDNPEIRNTREVWLEMIGRARRTLDLEEFYISDEPGHALEGVLAAVVSAADRGVKVRIIVDARMARTYPESLDRLGRRPGIEVRRIDFRSIAGGIQHAKYFIVDGRDVFVGSQNFDWRALEHIHELGLRIENPRIAAAYADVFGIDWKLAGLPADSVKGFVPESKTIPVPVRIKNASGADALLSPTFSPRGLIPDPALWDERAILSLIDGSRRSLLLQFLSYSVADRDGDRYTAVDEALRRAAKRGVKVRLLVSDWEKGTSAEATLKALSAVENIEVAFSVIPDWSGGYVPFARVEHCKYIVADGARFWLGTSNCAKDYFYASRNMGIAGMGPGLAGTLARIFTKSWNSPYREPVTTAGVYVPREHGEKKIPEPDVF